MRIVCLKLAMIELDLDSPHGYMRVSVPLAAFSHTASLGNRFPALGPSTIRANNVSSRLAELLGQYGRPQYIRSKNEPEFTTKDVR